MHKKKLNKNVERLKLILVILFMIVVCFILVVTIDYAPSYTATIIDEVSGKPIEGIPVNYVYIGNIFRQLDCNFEGECLRPIFTKGQLITNRFGKFTIPPYLTFDFFRHIESKVISINNGGKDTNWFYDSFSMNINESKDNLHLSRNIEYAKELSKLLQNNTNYGICADRSICAGYISELNKLVLINDINLLNSTSIQYKLIPENISIIKLRINEKDSFCYIFQSALPSFEVQNHLIQAKDRTYFPEVFSHIYINGNIYDARDTRASKVPVSGLGFFFITNDTLSLPMVNYSEYRGPDVMPLGHLHCEQEIWHYDIALIRNDSTFCSNAGEFQEACNKYVKIPDLIRNIQKRLNWDVSKPNKINKFDLFIFRKKEYVNIINLSKSYTNQISPLIERYFACLIDETGNNEPRSISFEEEYILHKYDGSKIGPFYPNIWDQIVYLSNLEENYLNSRVTIKFNVQQIPYTKQSYTHIEFIPVTSRDTLSYGCALPQDDRRIIKIPLENICSNEFEICYDSVDCCNGKCIPDSNGGRGVCVNNIPNDASCLDSERGVSDKLKGTVIIDKGSYQMTDYCSDERRLFEYWCRNGKLMSKTIICEQGCSEGICI